MQEFLPKCSESPGVLRRNNRGRAPLDARPFAHLAHLGNIASRPLNSGFALLGNLADRLGRSSVCAPLRNLADRHRKRLCAKPGREAWAVV